MTPTRLARATRLLFAIAVAAAGVPRPAQAQTLQEQVLEQKGLALQPNPGEWSVTLGGGIGAGPRFPGASTDRANSPIVQDRTQVVGVGLAYHF